MKNKYIVPNQYEFFNFTQKVWRTSGYFDNKFGIFTSQFSEQCHSFTKFQLPLFNIIMGCNNSNFIQKWRTKVGKNNDWLSYLQLRKTKKIVVKGKSPKSVTTTPPPPRYFQDSKCHFSPEKNCFFQCQKQASIIYLLPQSKMWNQQNQSLSR